MKSNNLYPALPHAPSPGFNFTCSPAPLFVSGAGMQSANLSCHISFLGAYRGPVHLRCDNPPAAFRCAFEPDVLPLPDDQSGDSDIGLLLVLKMAEGTQAGSYTLTIIADGGPGHIATHNLAIDVSGGPTPLTPTPKTLAPQATTPSMIPAGFILDVHGPTTGNHNGILEPGEKVLFEPTWTNPSAAQVLLNGNLTVSSGPGFTIQDSAASYNLLSGGTDSCRNTSPNACYSLMLADPTTRPSTHWDVSTKETIIDPSSGNSVSRTWLIHVGKTFTDVPVAIPADSNYDLYYAVEAGVHFGITAGCAAHKFCPDLAITRWQLATMLGRAMKTRGDYFPPLGFLPHLVDQSFHCIPNGGDSFFSDVSPTDFFCKYVHGFLMQNLPVACNPNLFCPNLAVQRNDMAPLLASAIAFGQDNVPDKIPNAYDCTDSMPNPLADIPDTDPVCKYAHYLHYKGVVLEGEDNCPAGRFCPSLTVTRGTFVKYLVRAFGLQLSPMSIPQCPQKPWSWGHYDLFDFPNVAIPQIKTIIDTMSQKGFGAFRAFVNAYFGGHGPGIHPYFYNTNQSAFNLCRWNPTYWNRVSSAIRRMRYHGYHKIMFTLGHRFQGPRTCRNCPFCDCDQRPWVNNTSNWSICNAAGGCNWIENWSKFSNPKSLPTGCTHNTTTAQNWIKKEYQRLAKILRQYGGDDIVIEVYNEASDASNSIKAHQALIAALTPIGVRVQVNIDPAVDKNSQCPSFNSPSFQNAWSTLIKDVSSWGVHSIRPACLANYPPNPFFWDMFNSGKLELSTDGQFCSNSLNLSCCHCCHVQTGEALDKALTLSTSTAQNYNIRFAPFLFEHSWGSVSQVPRPNLLHGIVWDDIENAEVACKFLDVCGTGCPGPILPDIKIRKRGGGDYQDTGPLIVDPGTQVDLFWNASFSNSKNPFTCSIHPIGSETLQGCGAFTPGCGTNPVLMTCAGKFDPISITTCGNGNCDASCETANNCPQECPCDNDGQCEQAQGENHMNCPNDCQQLLPSANIWVVDNNVSCTGFTCSYTIQWTSQHADTCSITENTTREISQQLSGLRGFTKIQRSSERSFTYTITCSNSRGTASADTTVIIPARNPQGIPSFNFTCNPYDIRVEIGGGDWPSICRVLPSNGFSGPVSFSCSNPPTGISCSFTPNPIDVVSTLEGRTNLVVHVAHSVPPGIYRFPVVASSPSLRQQIAFIVNVVVFVGPPNQPPDCSTAYAEPSTLWPPNHEFSPIRIQGVTDPDQYPIGIVITGIHQDEPTLEIDDQQDNRNSAIPLVHSSRVGSGPLKLLIGSLRSSASDKDDEDSPHCPDAFGLSSNLAHLRAERDGESENGRVYTVDFTAFDNHGGSCSGVVTVCVPHDHDHPSCVPDAPHFDSTLCPASPPGDDDD